MAGYKAEAYSKILQEGNEAKPLDNRPNSYSPEEYNKIHQRDLLIAQLEDTGEFVKPMIPIGTAEFNPDGSLRAIARTRPALFDVKRYTANRYMKQTISAQAAPKKGLKAGTYILVMWGDGMVDSAVNVKELPSTVRVFRFMKKTETAQITQEMLDNMSDEDKADVKVGDGFSYTKWVYVATERINREEAYKMNRELNSESMLELIQQIELHTSINSDEVTKDSLDEI